MRNFLLLCLMMFVCLSLQAQDYSDPLINQIGKGPVPGYNGELQMQRYKKVMSIFQTLLDDPNYRPEFKEQLKAIIPAYSAASKIDIGIGTGKMDTYEEYAKEQKIMQDSLRNYNENYAPGALKKQNNNKNNKKNNNTIINERILSDEEFEDLYDNLSEEERNELIKLFEGSKEDQKAGEKLAAELAIKKGIIASR